MPPVARVSTPTRDEPIPVQAGHAEAMKLTTPVEAAWLGGVCNCIAVTKEPSSTHSHIPLVMSRSAIAESGSLCVALTQVASSGLEGTMARAVAIPELTSGTSEPEHSKSRSDPAHEFTIGPVELKFTYTQILQVPAFGPWTVNGAVYRGAATLESGGWLRRSGPAVAIDLVSVGLGRVVVGICEGDGSAPM